MSKPTGYGLEGIGARRVPVDLPYAARGRRIRRGGRERQSHRAKLETNPQAVGIFGFSFLDQNVDKVNGAIIDGVAPTFEAIADHTYPVSRPLYFYVKGAHVGVIPGLRAFLTELTSERAWGDEGYLSYRGLIPMPEEERLAVATHVSELTPLAEVDQ